jgi:hypothetical protein
MIQIEINEIDETIEKLDIIQESKICPLMRKECDKRCICFVRSHVFSVTFDDGESVRFPSIDITSKSLMFEKLNKLNEEREVSYVLIAKSHCSNKMFFEN